MSKECAGRAESVTSLPGLRRVRSSGSRDGIHREFGRGSGTGNNSEIMRILMETHALAPIGGIEVNSLEVAERLTACGYDISVLYSADGSQRGRWEAVTSSMQHVRGYVLRPLHPRDLPQAIPALLAARRVMPDLVYLNHPELLPWAILCARGTRAALICHLHHPLPRAPRHPHLIRLLSREVYQFIAVSPQMRDYWVGAGVPGKKITVIRNGVAPDSYPIATSAERAAGRAGLGIAANAPMYLYFGRLIPDKGIHFLLQAWQAVRRKAPDAVLVLMGAFDDGPTGEAYRHELRGIGLDDCLLVPRQDNVLPILAASDVIVLPALWEEPFGRVVIEAMARGRPVVATRSGAIPGILTGEFARHIVGRDDPSELADAMLAAHARAAADPGLAQRCADHVATNFNLDTEVGKIATIIDSAVSRRKRWARSQMATKRAP
jgi:glycosyltransferase involved in cell wall biosynthesis